MMQAQELHWTAGSSDSSRSRTGSSKPIWTTNSLSTIQKFKKKWTNTNVNSDFVERIHHPLTALEMYIMIIQNRPKMETV